MLHLVGVTKGLTDLRAFRAFRGDKLDRIGHGIYCEMDDKKNLPEFMRANAVRIANHLYGQSVLSHVSAFIKGPVPSEESTASNPQYKLFLCGPYHKVTKFPHLTVVQFDTLANREVQRFCDPMTDGKEANYGEMRLQCASNELVLLQNFGRRGAHPERFLTGKQLLELREKLEERFEKDLVDRLALMMRYCGDFGREVEQATRFLSVPIEEMRKRINQASGASLMEFAVGWGGREIATLAHNGVSWSYHYVDNWKLPMQSEQSNASRTPAFINNLLPEGTIREMLRSRMANKGTGGTLLETSRRFMSNVAIVPKRDELKKLPTDELETPLSRHCDRHGVFQGRVLDLPPVGPRFLSEAADILCRDDVTRIAGMQPKMPMHLSYDGDLVPAVGLPTTHILKFAGIERDTANLKGVVEWASMSLAEGSGLLCSKFALVELPGSPNVLGFISERFDVPQNEEDMRMIFAEDLCSVMGLPPEAKGMPTLNDVVPAVKAQSTDWRADSEEFFRLVYVNYLLENADFHLKNASLLKVARPMLDGMRSVRMAPAYDIMRTAYFLMVPWDEKAREAMQLGFVCKQGNLVDQKINIAQFEEFADMCDVPAERAREIMKAAASGIAERARAMAADLPPLLAEEQFSKQRRVVLDILHRAVQHCHEFYPEFPAELNSDAIAEATVVSAAAADKPSPRRRAANPGQVRA